MYGSNVLLVKIHALKSCHTIRQTMLASVVSIRHIPKIDKHPPSPQAHTIIDRLFNG
jgi:hypothetical protein